MSHRSSVVLLVITAILWSFGGVLIKSVTLHPFAIAGMRSLVSSILLALAAKHFKFVWTRAQMGSVIFFTLTVICFVSATKLTTAANAILLQYTAPIYVALLSGPLLKEKITRSDFKALLLIMMGMLLFFFDRLSSSHFWGNVIALFSGIAFAGLTLCLRMQKGVSTFESLFLGHLLTGLIGIPFLIGGEAPSTQDLCLILVLGIFQLGIPYVLYGIAIRNVSAIEASLIPVIEPILNPIWVFLVIKEAPSKMAMLGGTVVLLATFWHVFVTIQNKRSLSNNLKSN